MAVEAAVRSRSSCHELGRQQRVRDHLLKRGCQLTACLAQGVFGTGEVRLHPQPALIHSKISGSDKLDRFTETGANQGSLGVFEAKYLLRYMQANAKAFDKFGA